MVDIEIIRGRERSYIISKSPYGMKWLQDNISYHNRLYNSEIDVVLSIQTELIKEFIKDIMDLDPDLHVHIVGSE